MQISSTTRYYQLIMIGPNSRVKQNIKKIMIRTKLFIKIIKLPPCMNNKNERSMIEIFNCILLYIDTYFIEITIIDL